MNLRKNRALSSRRRRLLRPLACVFGAALLAASSARASATIGYDSLVEGNAGGNAGMDLDVYGATFYVPFAFDFDGPYAIDSIRLLLYSGSLDSSQLSLFSLLITPTLGTDLTVPAALTTLSATGTLADSPTVYTFNADSSAVLTSGSTYYLRMAYAAPSSLDQPFWGSLLSISGTPPADSGDPDPKGGPPSGGHAGAPDDASVTLTALTTLNPIGGFTYRAIGGDGKVYDRIDMFGLAITATAVPEPADFAMLAGGLALGAVLLRRLRRRR